MEEVVQRKHDAQGPQLQSAKFATGDALAGIGADWTFVEQQVLAGDGTSPVAGTTLQRHTRLKQGTTEESQLLIDEMRIEQKASFEKAVASYARISLAGRDGYLVPNTSGGDSLLLVGPSNAILLTAIPQPDWKQALSPALAAYIATVNIP